MLRFGRKSDGALVGEVLAGDREAFGLLVERHLAAVQGVAYAVTRSAVDAEDLAQDAFLKAFQNLGQLRQPERFAPWTVQIVRNLAKDHARLRGREIVVEHLPEQADAPLDPGVRELHALLRREVMGLGEAFREAVVLHYFSGLPVGQIAQNLGISRAAAHKRLQRGRRELGERLTSLLGDALGAGRPGAARVGAIMAAVAGLTMPGRAGAVPAAAGGTLAGAGMAWYLGGLAVLLLALVGVVIFHPEQALDLEEAAAQDNWPGVHTAANETPSTPPPSASTASDGPLTAEPPDDGQEGVPGEIAGRVTDSRGIVLESVQVLGRGPAGRVDARTDADGQYRLSGLGDGPHQVSVSHHGYWPRTVEEVRPGTANVDFVLELMPAITGRVMDTQGRPISEALVRGIALGGGDTRVHTNEAGEYRLVHLPRAREAFELLAPAEYGLHVSAPGFQREIRQGVEVGSARVDFHLERGSSVAGRVLRSDVPVPVPDASVTLAGAETVTDADGFFEMDVPSVVLLRTESELVAIQARGYLQAHLQVEDFLDPAPGKRPEAFLQPAPIIEGLVLDDWDDPVPGAGVYLIGQPEQFAAVEREGFISRVEVHEEQEGTVVMSYVTFTDETGSFEIEAPLFWPESLHVRDPGAMMDEAWRGVAVSVPAWSTAPRVSLHVTLPGGYKLTGRLYLNGQPPADFLARVKAQGLATFDGLELLGFMHERAIPDPATGAFSFPRITVPSWNEAFQEGAPPAEWDTSISLRFRESPGENGPRNTHQFSLGPVTLREGQTRHIEWDLPLVLLRGRMAGEQRTGLRGANYSYTVRDNGPFRTNGTIFPDADGDFIVPLPPNATVEFELYLEETAGTVTVQTPAEGELTREFTLP